MTVALADPLAARLVSNRSAYLDLLESCLLGTIYEDPPIDPWAGVKTPVDANTTVVTPGVYDPKKRHFGHDWPLHAHTMVGTLRMKNVRQIAEYLLENAVPGDFIETGVWRGGVCIYLAGILKAYGNTERALYVCDSFEGLPKPEYPEDKGDIHHVYPQLAVSLEEVQANFRKYGLLTDDVSFVKGWFNESLPTVPSKQFALIRLDGDMYGSTMDALMALYDNLVPNGFVIVDDYHSVKGCKKAVDEFRELHDITDPLREIDGTGVYWQR